VTTPTPPAPAPLAALTGTRDGALLLAAAALGRIADVEGRAAFRALAIAYRVEYLRLRALQHTDAAAGAHLSVDDARASLATTVLPQLVALGVVTLPEGPLADDTPVAFAPALWAGFRAEPAALATLATDADAAFLRHQAAPPPALPARAPGSHLEAQGLVKSYRGRRVVNDVSVHVRQGEIVGLLGPNGAGKTTTFYMITGILRPEAGSVHLDGTDLTDLPMFRRARAGIGYLAQEPSVFRKLTVEQNVMAILETLRLSAAERAERLEGLLDELGLKHLRDQQAFQLSGGERRRLEITRALVTRPRFMLLDEPFAGVDPIAVHDIQTIVAGLRHRGIGVLITDHNVEQTLDIVDRAYIMFEGRVQVSGSVRDLVFDDRVAEKYLGPTLTARLRARLGQAA
jgi:lipopolysaccharide export system ATP-binding protein